MVSARVQKIKLMDLASNPVELSMEVLDRRRVTFLEFVGQKSETQNVLIFTRSSEFFQSWDNVIQVEIEKG